jgi:hypothetical protein
VGREDDSNYDEIGIAGPDDLNDGEEEEEDGDCNNEKEEVEEEEPGNVVDSFMWSNVIDPDLLRQRRSLDIRYPQILGDIVVYSVFEQEGFVAFNRFTGEELWDNRGQFNDNSIFNPILHDGIMYYVNGSGVRAFEMATGTVVYNTTDFIENQFLNADFGIYKDKIYVHADDFNSTPPIFDEWRVNRIDAINSSEWLRFNRVIPSQNNGKKRSYDAPTFYVDANGDDNMIYTAHESGDQFLTGTIAIISYNLTADSIKWVKQDFRPIGGIGRAPTLDGDRIYSGR